MTTSAIYALIHTIEKDGGVWFARGGTNALVRAMVRLFERLGGVLRLGDPVTRIDTAGNRATDVTTRSGWHGAADLDRKSVGEGKSVSVRVDLGGRRSIKKKKRKKT